MGSQINHIRDENDNEPGDCSSIDQIVYLQSRLMPRISIVYTQDWITCATVLKDHASNMGYTHLQLSSSQEESFVK